MAGHSARKRRRQETTGAIAASAKPTRRKGKGTQEQVPSPFKKALPAKYTALVQAHLATATTWVLLQKRGISGSLGALKGMVENSLGGREFTERHLRQLATIDPEQVVLRYVPSRDESSKRQELAVTFAINASGALGRLQAELGKVNRRFLQRLYDYIEREFQEYATWLKAAPDPRDILSTHIGVSAPDIPEYTLECERSSISASPGILDATNCQSLQTLVEEDFYRNQIVHVHASEEGPASFAGLGIELLPEVRAACEAMGVKLDGGLYSHQADAVEALLARQSDIVLATSTASGKSLCYNIAAAELLGRDRSATALYLFPTKALARDQLSSARRFFTEGNLLSEVEVQPFDGDVGHGYERTLIRDKARVVIANMDIIHVTLLPKHSNWKRFLGGLSLIVIDEAHYYRGGFGVNCAMVLRRLLSVCKRVHGRKPHLALCSATVGNATEHAQRLSGRPQITLVDNDGSPRNQKVVAIWNPPLKTGEDGDEGGDDSRGAQAGAESSEQNGPSSKNPRRSAIMESAKVLSHFMGADKRTIAFGKSRKLVEILTKTLHEVLDARSLGHLKSQVRSYRGGYLPAKRREIEQDLKDGYLQAVVATNALELGIDIGELEVSVHMGFPGSISSLWQQVGRVGRTPRPEPSASIVVMQSSPLEQHYADHPEEIFQANPESVVIDPENRVLLRRHLRCVIAEQPDLSEYQIADSFGPAAVEELFELMGDAEVTKDEENRLKLTAAGNRHDRGFSIRSIDDKQVVVQVETTSEILEQVEQGKAQFYVYPGAAYVHSGRTYLVRSLDYEAGVALLRAADDKLPYYTSTLDRTFIHILRDSSYRELSVLGDGGKQDAVGVHFGCVKAEVKCYAYQKVLILTKSVLETCDLDLAPLHLETTAIWFDVPPRATFKDLSEDDYYAGLHGVEHLLTAFIPLFILVDESDLFGWTVANHKGTGRAQIFIYETVPSGMGIVREVFERHLESIFHHALNRIRSCQCRHGCPSCIQLPKCGYYNDKLNKEVAKTILEYITPCKIPKAEVTLA